MKPYPHVFQAAAPPPDFDGPGGVWSPETLLVASIADCFMLTFRGVSRAARLERAEKVCLVATSLHGGRVLKTTVHSAAA